MQDEQRIELGELKLLVEAQGRAIDEIRASQIRVANALLGSLDRESIGLIEGHRVLRKEMDINNNTIQSHDKQINELNAFKGDMKKVVAGIALLVPVLFEIVKNVGGMVWTYLATVHK